MGNKNSTESRNEPKARTPSAGTKAGSRQRGSGDLTKSYDSTAVSVPRDRRRHRSWHDGAIDGDKDGDSSTVSPELKGKSTLKVIPSQKSIKLMVAAIDFGTTYSGYAYSFAAKKEDFITNYWQNRSQQEKTPTVVLLTPQGQFHSFGQEAIDFYQNLAKEKRHGGWYYFERFKMRLFLTQDRLSKDMEIEDIEGKKMPAVEIFAMCINYIKDHLLGVLNAREENVAMSSSDIHWVLTVPAIWKDSAKQFMREAANKAGIPDNLLTIALEPEAASLFCKSTPTTFVRRTDGTVMSRSFPPGIRYLVFDLGGGTADITSHEISTDGTLVELHQPTGGDFGGTSVDNEFLKVLKLIFGGDVIKKFKDNFMDEYQELLRDFEIKKRHFDGSDTRVNLKFPVVLLEIYEDIVGMAVHDSMEQSRLKDDIELKLGKMIISSTKFKEFFDVPVDKILEKAEELDEVIPNISYVVMVGGFSESRYIQTRMKEKFAGKVKIPNDPSLAVLKGAVLYGHEPTAIASRVCKYTYGIARMMKFKENHDPRKRVVIDNVEYVDDLFNKHIEVGQAVKVGEKAKTQDYYPPAQQMKQAVLEVYASTQKNPMYIDEPSCQFVGLLRIDIPKYVNDPKWKIDVGMNFSGTELEVDVYEVKTGDRTKSYVDFLG